MPGVDPPRDGDEPVEIAVEDLERCPRYIGRLFRDVQLGESPAWLKARLAGAGMRPISNVVDVTNYVMLALGSPLHAFDYDTLTGGRIVVRRARPGEQLETLDGTMRELDPEDLVIADAEKPIAIGGVMGGGNTEVSDTTANVLLEAANFEPLTVLRSGERHRMRTESQTRWEKGVDPELAGPAARYASQLLVELAGARWTGEGEVRGELPAPPVIAFRPGYTNDVARPRGAGGRAARPPRPARLRGRGRLDGAHADLARARRAPRHRRRRGGRALPARGRARDAARPAGDVRAAGARAAAAPAGRGRARRRGALRGVHVLAAGDRSRSERARAARCRSARSSVCCARRSRSGCSAPRSTTSTWGTPTSSSSRSRTSTCRPGRCPSERVAPRRHRPGRLLQGEGDRRGRLRGAAHRAGVRARAAARRVRRRRVGAVGLGRHVRPARARRRVERVRARPRRAVRARARAHPLPRRDHVPAAAARPRLRRRRRCARRRADGGRARRRRRGAARGALPQRLPRRPDPERQASRSRSRSRSSRRSARSPTRTRRACATRSSARSPGRSAPSFGPRRFGAQA